ncbi:hypothetical protein CKJ90_27460, partial [Klebsiella pneumoniae]
MIFCRTAPRRTACWWWKSTPFERTPPWSVYVPPQDKVEVTADSDLELAVCS